MANLDRPRGFAPIGTLSGSPWQASQKLFYLDGSANTIAISVGDLVVMTAGGYLNCLAAGAGATDLVGVVTAIPPADATFSTTTGTFGGHSLSATEPTLVGAGKNTVAASTAGYVMVCTAPDAILVGQEDGVATPLTLAAVGAAVDIINAGSNATTGLSGMEIDSSSVGTTANDPLKLLGLHNIPGNELASVDTTKPWADWMVVYNTTWMQDNGGV
jgi:hypothetical protein